MLQILAAALAAGSGTLALLTEFKEKPSGRITKWGRWALAGIILAFVISLTTAGYKQFKAQRDAELSAQKALEELKRHEVLISEIHKAVFPIREVYVSGGISVPMDHSELQPYRNALEAAIEDLEKDGEEIVSFRVPSESPLRPTPDRHQLVYMLIHSTRIQVAIYKALRDIESYQARRLPPNERGDLVLLSRRGISRIDYQTQRRELNVYTQASDPARIRTWKALGGVVGFKDLLGSRVFISLILDGTDLPHNLKQKRQLVKTLQEMQLTAEPRNIHLRIGNYSMSMSGLRPRMHKDLDGNSFYVIDLPDSSEEFSKLLR